MPTEFTARYAGQQNQKEMSCRDACFQTVDYLLRMGFRGLAEETDSLRIVFAKGKRKAAISLGGPFDPFPSSYRFHLEGSGGSLIHGISGIFSDYGFSISNPRTYTTK
jgi:hypothetical protein